MSNNPSLPALTSRSSNVASDKKWFDGGKGIDRQYLLFEYSYRGLIRFGKLAAPAKAAEHLS